MSKVIVLGAKGRFGRAAVTAFLEAGWDVTALARNWDARFADGVTCITGDVKDAAALTAACTGQDVIVNAVNPSYELWVDELPAITASVIEAAKRSGAHVLIPGNVYNYGAAAPVVLKETTAWHPTTRKGRLRVDMEEAYRTAGVPTIILRAGDFIDTRASGNWFDQYIAVDAEKGRTMYPGPLDRVHAWAYLPDVARAAVMLAERRDELGPFEQVNFDGYTLTGAELVREIEKAVSKPQKVRGLPWFLLRLIGVFQPLMREVYEMRYLWRVPHRVDGTKLARMVPQFRPTPVSQAFRTVLAS